MDNKINYTLLGAFVIALFSAIVLAIIWLSSGLSVGDYKTYQVNMQEAVTGLSVDAVVEFNGVNVGKVKRISISQRNPHLVVLLLDVLKNTPVTEATTARLNTRGLTGITYIALHDKGTNLRPLMAQPGSQYPIIKTEPSLFLQLDAALTKLNDNFRKVTDALSTLLDEQNQKSIKQILINLDEVTATLAGNSAKMSVILNNTANASQKFPELMRSGSATLQSLQNQTIPALNRTFSNIDDVTRSLSQLSAEIKQNPAILIRGKEPQPLGPGEK